MFEKARVKVLQDRQLHLEKVITELMRVKNNLVDKVDELKIQNKRLGIKRDMEEEQVAHKLAMREEAHDLTNRKLLQTEKEECAKDIREVKDTYRDK